MITKFTIAILNSMLHHLLYLHQEKIFMHYGSALSVLTHSSSSTLPFFWSLIRCVSAIVCLSLLERFCTIVCTSVFGPLFDGCLTGLILSHPDSFGNSAVCLGIKDFRLWCFW
jgi:uncharacterized membrane-anchored protein YitT (DUF2179 family)